jgi:DNA-binding Lrp family transcriptional regulator
VDRTDVSLCLFLMSNSRTPYHELASRLGLSINAVHKRIRAMIDLGIIRAFRARPSLISLGTSPVWVFGRSEAAHPAEVHLCLSKNDSTYWVASSGGGLIYVGGYLKSLSELDAFVTFVKREGEMTEPTVGIIPLMASRFPNEKLHPIDYQILASLNRDARKAASDVGSEVNASAKTVHRRLERMVEKDLVDFTIDWYPDASNDIISLCHVDVAAHSERLKVRSQLQQSFGQNVLLDVIFGNLPNQVVLFLWTNSMKQMDDLREAISKKEGVKSVMLNVLQIGYMFDTWRDKLVLSGGESAASVNR